MSDRLEKHGLPGSRCGNDQSPLSFSNGREKVHHPGGVIFRIIPHFQVNFLLGIKGSEVVEENFIPRHLRVFIVDQFHFQHGEIPFRIFGGTNLARDGITRSKIESPNLRGRDVNVIWPGQIIVVGGSQKTKPVGQDFEHPFPKDQAVFFRLGLKNSKNQFLLSHPARPFHIEFLGDLVQFINLQLLQIFDVHIFSFTLPYR